MALRKKQRLQASPNTTSLTDATLLTSFDALTDDTIIMIFGFLPPEDIMRTRLSTKLRAAACAMIIPPSDYRVRRYKVMDAMTKALPNMQQITIDNLGFGQKYVDGEEPNEDRVKYTDGHITRDIVKILTSPVEWTLCSSLQTPVASKVDHQTLRLSQVGHDYVGRLSLTQRIALRE
jgi:hypothetical protein